MSDSIGQMTQPYVENDNTTSMKVTPCSTKAAFVDPFPGDLESLFLEEDAVSTGYAILKQKSAMIEDTKCPVLGDLGGRVEVSANLVEIMVTIPDTMAVLDSGVLF